MTKKKTDKAPNENGDEMSAIRKSLQPYFDSYPGRDTLHLTSDGTPFLEKQWAVEHQKTVDPDREVITVNR